MPRIPLRSKGYLNTRAPQLGTGAHIMSGCVNQQRFCPPGRDQSLLETHMSSEMDNAQNLVDGYSLWVLPEGRGLRENWNPMGRYWVAWIQGEG